LPDPFTGLAASPRAFFEGFSVSGIRAALREKRPETRAKKGPQSGPAQGRFWDRLLYPKSIQFSPFFCAKNG
jgi:hypothetical protein